MYRRCAGALLLCALFAATGCSAYGPHRPHETIHRNVVFASPQGRNLSMDLYVPDAPRPAPVVIWIFGGSWKTGFKGYHVNVRSLTDSGIAVAAIEYRLSGVAKYPAQLEDCKSATQWLRENGARYGIDPQRIGASGESAGGHLAALLGTVEGKAKIRAVMALYPPTDLVSLGRMYEEPGKSSDIDRLLGGPVEEKLPLAREASPVNHVTPSSPPFLIIHGADDKLVPVAQSQKLLHALRAAGVDAQLIVVPDKGHWFLLDKAQQAEAATFFRKNFTAVK